MKLNNVRVTQVVCTNGCTYKLRSAALQLSFDICTYHSDNKHSSLNTYTHIPV